MNRMARLFSTVLIAVTLALAGGLAGGSVARAQSPEASLAGTPAATPDLLLTGASVTERSDLGILVFEQTVEGIAGATTPTPIGQLDGAPVLAYVFPTSLPSTAVGFGEIDGILALAVTAHPDFDDTPLWDENLDGTYDNDGLTWHTHWVVLGPDERVPGGLAVLEIQSNGPAAVLPPTAPGMPMYMDSPGFAVQLSRNTLRAIVPVDRVGKQTDFNYDAVTCYLQVNGSDPDRPMLGVYAVYSVLSGDLSLPYAVDHA